MIRGIYSPERDSSTRSVEPWRSSPYMWFTHLIEGAFVSDLVSLTMLQSSLYTLEYMRNLLDSKNLMLKGYMSLQRQVLIKLSLKEPLSKCTFFAFKVSLTPVEQFRSQSQRLESTKRKSLHLHQNKSLERWLKILKF